MQTIIRKFLGDRSAATAIEYGLIVAVLSLAMLAGFGQASNSLQNLFFSFSNTLDESQQE